MSAVQRLAILLATAAVLGACGAHAAGPSGADASAAVGKDADVAVPPDAAIIVDAGQASRDAASAAPDAGQPPDAQAQEADAASAIDLVLSLAANPNNVLSAAATVSWTGKLTSVSIRYEGAETPSFDISRARSPIVEPVLGLRPSTSYALRAVATDPSGNTVESEPVAFETGPIPSGVPQFKAGGTPSGTGFTLLAISGYGQYGPTIVDASGQVVWYYRLPDGTKADCDFQQQPDGTFTVDVESGSFWTGNLARTFYQLDALGSVLHEWTGMGADGSGDVVDVEGNQLHVALTDEHEVRIRPDGSALLFGEVHWGACDLSSVGGQAKADCWGNVLEHVRSDGTVDWAWNAADHVSSDDLDPGSFSISTPGVATVVNVTHANSIDVTQDGNYLVSFRNLSQVLKIDSTTGEVIWRLGGAGLVDPTSQRSTGDFAFVNDPTAFSCQHAARELGNGNIILFDDGNGHSPSESRVVEYALDTTAMTATMVWQSRTSSNLYTDILGYGQRLSGGNTLGTYGTEQIVLEWDSSGTQPVWTLRATTAPFGAGFYRAFRIGSLYSYSPR